MDSDGDVGDHGANARMPAAPPLLAIAIALSEPALPAAPPAAEAPARPAAAPPRARHDCDCTHGGTHKEHTRNLVGAKFYNINIFEVGSRDEAGELEPGTRPVTVYPMLGAGLFYERELVRNWLEIELNVLFLTDPHATIVPIELFFKKPWHVHRSVTPYVGAGPTLDILLEERRPFVFFGLSATAGAYFWITRSFGFDLDIAYTLVFERIPAHELGLGFGPVIHF